MLTEIAVIVSESPVSIVTELASAIDSPNVPEDDSDQNDRSVITCPFVPAHDVHDGSVPFAAMLPADADPHVTAGRVVTLATLVVPADPGGPVCSCA
jgi:hypothetical protein